MVQTYNSEFTIHNRLVHIITEKKSHNDLGRCGKFAETYGNVSSVPNISGTYTNCLYKKSLK